MDQELIINKTKKYIKDRLFGEGSGHDWYHVERVYKMAEYIGKKEGADLFIVRMAALMHDVSDHKFHKGNSDIGALITKEWLEQLRVEKSIVQIVTKIVKTISFKAGTVNSNQDSLEGKVVQDADRLDAIGAIGIARTFTYGGKKEREIFNPDIKPREYVDYKEYIKTKNHTINHFYEKLLLLKDLMNTETAKKIALERHELMERYLKQFMMEWDGLDFG